jgi:hypothetical protein
MNDHPLAAWHRLIEDRDPSGLDALLADDAVFHSPVVHTPQRGRVLTAMYLHAAFDILANPSFHYVREITGRNDAALEFETEVDGTMVNGIDLITWNDAGFIIDFKVMLRPMKAIDLVRDRMAKALQSMSQER